MRFVICLAVWSSVVAIAACLLGWTTYYHVVVGGVAISAVAAVYLTWVAVCHLRASHRTTRLQESLVRSVIGAILLAVVSVGTVRSALGIAGVIPGVNPYFHDGDRPELAAKLQVHEAASEFAASADLVRERLAQPISPAWKAVLDSQLPQLYVKAGIHALEPVDQVRYFDLAARAMRAAGQGSAAVESLLEQAKREADYLARIDAMRDNSQWNDLIAELDVAIKAPQPWRYPFAVWLVEACIKAGEASEYLQQKLQLFTRAAHVADTYALDPSHARALLANAEQQQAQDESARAELEKMLAQAADAKDLTIRINLLELAADYANRHELNAELIDQEIRAIRLDLMPRELAPGTTAKLLGIEERDPFLLVDFLVRSAEGTPIMLDAKDVALVSVAGKPALVESLGLAPARTAPLYTVLCLDYSASTKGEPQRHARNGAAQLFRSIDAKFQLVAFSDKVWNLSSGVWSTDPAQLRAQLDSLTVGGGTRLVAGLNYATRRFPEHATRRNVILLSDGVDSNGTDPEHVLDFCGKNNITVHTIGLRGGDRFDARNLQHIATATGGRYLEAAQADELVSLFVRAAAEIRQRPLRLLCKAPAHGPVELTIGRGRHALRMASR